MTFSRCARPFPPRHHSTIDLSFFRSKITETLTFLRPNSLFKPTELLCTFIRAGIFPASLVHGATNTFLNTLKSVFVRTSRFCGTPFSGRTTKGADCICSRGTAYVHINFRSSERRPRFLFVVVVVRVCVSALSFSCYNSCSFLD